MPDTHNTSPESEQTATSAAPQEEAAEGLSESTKLYRSLAQEFIAEHYPAASMRPLRRKIRRALRLVRRTCLRFEESKENSGFREWLDDNYHLLSREGESVIAQLRFAGAQPRHEGWPATCAMFCKLIRKSGVPTIDQLDELVDAVQRVRPLTVFELEQLPLCLRAALILIAAEACEQAEPEEAQRLISTAVQGLRRVIGLDFAGLTERHSIVERILREDPSGIYEKMDDASRADYRRRTALAALRSDRSEAATAAALVDKAKEGTTPRERHIGVPLMAWGDGPARRSRGRVLLLCMILLPLLAALLLAVLVQRPLFILLLYIPLVELLRPVISRMVLRGMTPVRLPRLELEGHIPEEGRTVITVSTLLPSASNAAKMAGRLFELYNTNGQGAVQICLLADLPQGDYPTLPRDAADIAAMQREIRRLNEKTDGKFVLAVRGREYSPTMRAYTGRERKRGAILELIRVIRGGQTEFLAFEGDLEQLRRAKYLLALDTDTVMLMDTASELVATALHPLAKARLSEDGRRVEEGYGILVPRIGTELHSANHTPFSRAMAGIGGVPPYDIPAGDVYMDCFGEAVFTGKGLIDVEAFGLLFHYDLPAEQILSHDILEGCLLHAGLVSDIEMEDGFPSSMGGWLDRLHRWIRGDWQNAPFLWNHRLPLNRLDRWKLIDNLRRSLTPAVCVLCLLLSPLIGGRAGQLAALVGLVSPVAAYLLSAASALLQGGWLTLGGRYYSRVLPRAMSALNQAWYTLVMLPATAVTGVDAAVRACARLISRRRLLEWMTAAQGEKRRMGLGAAVRRLWLPLVITAVLLTFGTGFARLGGIIFLVLVPLAVYSERPRGQNRSTAALTGEQQEQISAYAAATWRYYEEQCTPEEHYLPPDNLQEAPVWRVAHRTSPTNMGLYLLCCVAAHDFHLIDTDNLLDRVDHTLTTIERLDKWQGNLLNWYDTHTLRPLSPRYVSTVDSGNFACCLVTLRQALLELGLARAEAVAERVHTLYTAIDLRPMYNAQRALFHIGLDPDTGEVSPSYYDLLMSESRMTGYYAIAGRIIPRRHWGTLGRTLTRAGNAVGPVSWTGSMFEYFMPRLLLPAEEGTMGYEALRFCLYCQRRRPPRHVPWGISESGFYAFDSNLNYQYKAHGVPRLALKRGMGTELVISPYSSFLTLCIDAGGALRNLSQLEKLGMLGSCGFYEAADFTAGRAARGGYSVVRSYMAHHVGMSLIACANAMHQDSFVHRFLRDTSMARAKELCAEKAPSAGTVYEPTKEGARPEPPGRTKTVSEEINTINVRSPRMHLLAGTEWQLAITDTGAGISGTHGLDIHRFSGDLLRAPQGIFVVLDDGEGSFSVTEAPQYVQTQTVVHHAEFEAGAAIFTAVRGHLEAGMRVMVHPRLPCEERQVVVRNHANHRVHVNVMLYFEPSLARREDEQAHPAFSRLFLSAHHDAATGALLITRRQRMGEAPICLAVGLLEQQDYDYETSREALLRRPLGISSLIQASGQPFASEGQGIPDVAVAMRLTLEVMPHAQKEVTFVLTAAPTPAQAINRLIAIRREGLLGEHAATVPFGGVERELAKEILPDLFYPPRMSREWAAAARENTKGQRALWALGISGDFPIVLLEIHNAADASRAEPYMRLHHSLRMGGVTMELAIVYHEGGDYDAPVLEALREAASNAGSSEMLGARGGIHFVNTVQHGKEALALLTAVCAHDGARDLSRTGLLPSLYREQTVLPVQPGTDKSDAKQHGEQENTISIPGGIFADDRFIVTEKPFLPWCYVLANPTFGTLVSDRSLGYTWAVNSRENKLTPWSNDTASDNRGERVLVHVGGHVFDVVWGAQAEYGPGTVRYAGRAGTLRTLVTVRVPKRGMWKTVELDLENEGGQAAEIQAAYYTEPVLGVDRRYARHTTAHWEEGALLLSNPFAAVSGCAILTALGGADGCDCDRGSFLSGTWGGGTLSPLPDPCGAVIVRRKLPPRRKEKVTFVLGFAAGTKAEQAKNSVLHIPALAQDTRAEVLSLPRIRTPEPLLNTLAETWLPRQALYCRIYARTGFYQCGGAWGFRDQLQDSLAALWFDPAVTRRQLMRCAGAQFTQGDVLHWWYQLPGSLRGVRTHCSDDLAWLAYVTAEYVRFTGDTEVLEARIRWLTGEPLKPDEKDRYFEPARTEQADTLYEHCVRALERAVTKGEHGLPLIGSGDWNDGFSLLGIRGRGESVWLALFLTITLEAFAPLSQARGDEERANWMRQTADEYRRAAGDCFSGDRFVRAFFDDGSPLGVPGGGDGAMDSLSQSFAVFSGLPSEQVNKALDTALAKLVDRRSGVVKLLSPPFARSQAEKRAVETTRQVGYITAYPPGLRENGGQYTHAAVWLAMALLQAGRAAEGVEVLQLLNTAQKYADGLGKIYRGEPYALAGDVYSHPECPGRAGWTLYTGSAGWYYTAVLRDLLGLQPRGDRLELRPHLPPAWEGAEVELTLHHTPLHIRIQQGQPSLIVDGQPAETVELNGTAHVVVCSLPYAQD